MVLPVAGRNPLVTALMGVSLFILPVLAACGGEGSQAEASDHIARCVKKHAAAYGQHPPGSLVTAVESICRDADDHGALEAGGEIAGGQDVAILRRHMDELLPAICADLERNFRASMPAEERRYMTEAESKNFADRVCVLRKKYMRADGSIDEIQLTVDHPELSEPFCRAGLRWAFTTGPDPTVPPQKVDKFARMLCARLVEEHLVVASGPDTWRIKRRSPQYRLVLREVLIEIRG
jgi:hypothetical protein